MSKKSVENGELPTVEEIVGEGYDDFYKEVTLYWNGKQFVMGIPEKLVRILDIKEGDKFVFDVKTHSMDRNKDVLGFYILRSNVHAPEEESTD